MSGNQCSTGDSAFRLAEGHPLYDQILNMSEAQANAALNALSGELHASARAQLATQSDGIRLAALERLQSTSQQAGTGLWFDMLYSDAELNGSSGIATLDSQSRGLLLGADGYLQNGWRLGVLGGYQDSDMDLSARMSSAEVDSLYLGVYASRHWDNNWHLSLGSTFGQHQLQTQRHAVGQTLKADYDASSWQAFAETGYRFESDTGWVQPFVGLSWLNQRNDAFKESGGSAALAVERTESNTGFANVGVRGGAELGADPLPVRVQGSISWRHAVEDIDTVSEHRFLGGDSRFTIKGAPIAENTVVLDAGLVVPVSKNTDISFGYRGEHSDESDVQEGYIQMSVRF